MRAPPEPAAFVATTSTRSTEPESAAVSVYVEEIAPATSAHAPVVALQRRHWNANAVGVPVQVPVVAVSVAPGPTMPSISGAAVTVGEPGGPATKPVAAEVDVAAPSRFRPETVTRSVEARSPFVSVYVGAVAPGIGEQPVVAAGAALPLVRERDLVAGPRAGRRREGAARAQDAGHQRRRARRGDETRAHPLGGHA